LRGMKHSSVVNRRSMLQVEKCYIRYEETENRWRDGNRRYVPKSEAIEYVANQPGNVMSAGKERRAAASMRHETIAAMVAAAER